MKALETTEETHGPRGVGYAELARYPDVPQPADAAARAIVEAGRRRPGEVRLITLGPMTNLAMALVLEPDLPGMLGGWTLMGGAYRAAGNTTPVSEWNLHVDPDAARACFAAWASAIVADASVGLPLAMGLDVTESARLVPAHLRRIAELAGAGGGRQRARSRTRPPRCGRPARWRRTPSSASSSIRCASTSSSTPATTASTAPSSTTRSPLPRRIDPTLVTTRPVFVDVETGPGLAHGMTIADWRGLLGRPANVAVAVSADAETFLERLVTRLGSPGGRYCRRLSQMTSGRRARCSRDACRQSTRVMATSRLTPSRIRQARRDSMPVAGSASSGSRDTSRYRASG